MKLVSTPKVTMMALGEIRFASFNPPTRIEADALKELKASIEEIGLLYPLLVSRDGSLIDGHRRYTCLKELGYVEAPVIVVSLGLQEGWNNANITKAIDNRDWIYVGGEGFSPENMPRKKRKQWERLNELIGDEGIKLMANRRMSFGVLAWGRAVARYVDDPTDGFLSRCLMWLIRHKMQYQARKAMEEGCDPAIIVAAINRDKPLVNSWEVDA